jgi:hypothetical protein
LMSSAISFKSASAIIGSNAAKGCSLYSIIITFQLVLTSDCEPSGR